MPTCLPCPPFRGQARPAAHHQNSVDTLRLFSAICMRDWNLLTEGQRESDVAILTFTTFTYFQCYGIHELLDAESVGNYWKQIYLLQIRNLTDIIELWCKRTSRHCPIETAMTIWRLIQLELPSFSSDHGRFTVWLHLPIGSNGAFNWNDLWRQMTNEDLLYIGWNKNDSVARDTYRIIIQTSTDCSFKTCCILRRNATKWTTLRLKNRSS